VVTLGNIAVKQAVESLARHVEGRVGIEVVPIGQVNKRHGVAICDSYQAIVFRTDFEPIVV